MVRIKLELLRQMASLTLTEAQIEHGLRYVDAYLEETEPGALQRELAAMNQAEYREAARRTFSGLGPGGGRAEGLEQGHERGLVQGLEQGIEQGLELGLEKGKLESARKMREHGIDWKIVTDVTGMRPEDLEG